MIFHSQKPFMSLLTALLIIALILAGRIYVQHKISTMAAHYEGVIADQMDIIERQDKTIQRLNEQVDYEQMRIDELVKLIDKGFAGWVPVEMEVTGYAPLDENAVEGMCYSGAPTITASGAPSQPGISIAAGPGVPFGTEIYVPGYGVGVVHDRGGAISDRHIDLMFATRGQALGWGRQTVIVWVRE